MTKAEILSSVIELSGRFDLTEEMSPGQTKGDFFLNGALRFLDTNQQNPESQKNLVKDIHRTQFKLAFENARAVREVWIDIGDGEKLLEKVSLKEVNESYPEKMFQDGNPYINPNSIVFNATSNTISDATGGLLDAGFVAGGYVKVVGSENRDNDGIFYIVSIEANGNSMEIWKGTPLTQEDSTNHPDLILTPVSFTAEVGSPTYYAIDSIHLAPQQRLLTFDQNEFNADYFKVMYNSVGYNAIWIAPPPESDGVLRLVADFFSVMENDTDICYWSVVYPNVLVQATLFAIEVFYRNTTGMRDMLASLEPFLTGIDKDLADEKAVDINQMEG